MAWAVRLNYRVSTDVEPSWPLLAHGEVVSASFSSPIVVLDPALGVILVIDSSFPEGWSSLLWCPRMAELGVRRWRI